MADFYAYAGLFLAAFMAATLLPMQSEAVLAGLLVAGCQYSGRHSQLGAGALAVAGARQPLVPRHPGTACPGRGVVSPLWALVLAVQLAACGRRPADPGRRPPAGAIARVPVAGIHRQGWPLPAGGHSGATRPVDVGQAGCGRINGTCGAALIGRRPSSRGSVISSTMVA